MTAVLEAVAPGTMTRIEDLGTHRRAHLGFSVGGAADMRSLALANRAVGNEADACALEATHSGPTLRFLSDGAFAWCGGDWPVTLNDTPVARLTATHARAGAVLRVGACRAGLRAAVAFAGGVHADAGSLVTRGQLLAVGQRTGTPLQGLDALLDERALDDPAAVWTLRVTDAPQTHWFTPDSLEAFLGEIFTVTPDVSRRGVHVRGAALLRVHTREPVSEGIAPGSIQVTHAGDPIVLHVDQTTTGGYAKIACVARVDLWKTGQLRPGSRLRFARVNLDEAQRALHAWHGKLASLG
jgi:antagonist of KipI